MNLRSILNDFDAQTTVPDASIGTVPSTLIDSRSMASKDERDTTDGKRNLAQSAMRRTEPPVEQSITSTRVYHLVDGQLLEEPKETIAPELMGLDTASATSSVITGTRPASGHEATTEPRPSSGTLHHAHKRGAGMTVEQRSTGGRGCLRDSHPYLDSEHDTRKHMQGSTSSNKLSTKTKRIKQGPADYGCVTVHEAISIQDLDTDEVYETTLAKARSDWRFASIHGTLSRAVARPTGRSIYTHAVVRVGGSHTLTCVAKRSPWKTGKPITFRALRLQSKCQTCGKWFARDLSLRSHEERGTCPAPKLAQASLTSQGHGASEVAEEPDESDAGESEAE